MRALRSAADAVWRRGICWRHRSLQPEYSRPSAAQSPYVWKEGIYSRYTGWLKRELNVYCIYIADIRVSETDTLHQLNDSKRIGSKIFKMHDAYWTNFESSFLHIQWASRISNRSAMLTHGTNWKIPNASALVRSEPALSAIITEISILQQLIFWIPAKTAPSNILAIRGDFYCCILVMVIAKKRRFSVSQMESVEQFGLFLYRTTASLADNRSVFTFNTGYTYFWESLRNRLRVPLLITNN